MALQYRIYQDTRKTGSKLFYGRAVHPATVGFDEVCRMVQANTSAKQADVKLVLTEYIEQMKFFLQHGYKVEWEKIGTFYITGLSSAAATVAAASAKQMHDPHLAFVAKWTRPNGVTSRAYTEGVKLEKAK